LLGVLFYERAYDARRPWLFLILSGFSLGITPWVKQTAAVQVAGLFIWAAVDGWRSEKKQLKRVVTRWPILVLGVLMATASTLGLLAGSDMLGPMLDISRYSSLYYPSISKVLSFSTAQLVTLYGLYSIFWTLRFGLLAFPFLIGI